MKSQPQRKTLTILTAAAFTALIGCSHRLEIKNLAEYSPSNMTPLSKKISIGIVSADQDLNMNHLLNDIGKELENYAGKVVYPYKANTGEKVDLIADIRIRPEYSGSGANFFINFPGFLVWAPAWHGYNYKVTYNIDVNLVDASKNEKIDQFSLPMKLDVRHAAINRTWTEISWLEVGIIALVGGVSFTSYDPKVTPLAAQTAGETVGEYVGQAIIQRVNSSGKFTFLLERLLNGNLIMEG